MGIPRPTACARRRGGAYTPDGATRGCGPGTHRNEGETAARGDVDAPGDGELGVGADTVAEASDGVASDGGGLPGGEVDAADVSAVLRCMGGGGGGGATYTAEEPANGAE